MIEHTVAELKAAAPATLKPRPASPEHLCRTHMHNMSAQIAQRPEVQNMIVMRHSTGKHGADGLRRQSGRPPIRWSWFIVLQSIY